MSRALRFAPLVLLLLVIAALVWRLATPTDTQRPLAARGQAAARIRACRRARRPSRPRARADLATGQPRLLNVFASWCVPCVGEAPVLQQLKARGVAIDGIAVRDTARGRRRIPRPQRRSLSSGSAATRRAAVQIALGSSGVPESFVVDGKGIIRHQHIGPIEPATCRGSSHKLEQAR